MKLEHRMTQEKEEMLEEDLLFAGPDKDDHDREVTEIQSNPKLSRNRVSLFQNSVLGRPIDFVPLQDFDPETLKQLAAFANQENCEIVIERITFKPLKRQRAEEAIKFIKPSDYARSLQCLDKDIAKVAGSLLHRFHGDPDRPNLHIIKMGDMSRKMVNIHCRPVLEDDGQWLSFSKEPALTTLSEHTAGLLSYLIQRALQMLQFKVCLPENLICLSICVTDEGRNLIVFNQRDKSGDADFLESLGYSAYVCVDYYDGELSDISSGLLKSKKAQTLANAIHLKMEEVTKQLGTLKFSEKDIMKFLEMSRRPFLKLPEELVPFSSDTS
jgi:hypothetical protein